MTIILLLWGVGAAALLLMNDSTRKFEIQLKKDYAVINAAQTCRTITATINSRYLSLLASPPNTIGPDRVFFDQQKALLLDHLDVIRLKQPDSRWESVITRFDSAIQTYLEGYEVYFSGALINQPDRVRHLQYMSSQTQRLTDLSENMLTLAEEKLFTGTHQLGRESGKNVLLIVTLVLLGTCIAALIYYQLVRQLVDPVVGLQQSIEEIRNGNFELTLPPPSQGSEFRSVATAFNDMAAELRVRRRETDEGLLRVNLVNRAMLEAIPSPVYILGDDTGIVQINPAAESLSDQLGVSKRIPLKIQRILDDCKKNGSHFLPEDPREALLFRIDEKEYYYLPRIFRFESETGSAKQSGWAILLCNVSRIRWLDDMKTNLISTVSHEIKTPLTGIRMVLHLLLEERSGKLDEIQSTMVASANEDCERLLATLNSLLDLSRAESGTTHLSRSSAPVLPVLQHAAKLYRVAAKAKDVDIEIEAPDTALPDVFIDPVRLDEVMNNLVSNAIKHSPPHSKIILRLIKPDADFIRISVIDKGPGVPEASQSRIFERFFRAPDQGLDGVGLGLFISREIMRAHEGRIGLMERDNDETEFYIDVPIA